MKQTTCKKHRENKSKDSTKRFRQIAKFKKFQAIPKKQKKKQRTSKTKHKSKKKTKNPKTSRKQTTNNKNHLDNINNNEPIWSEMTLFGMTCLFLESKRMKRNFPGVSL